MIRLDCKQGSPEWHEARRGILTASRFSSVLTPKTLKPSSQADGYVLELLAQWLGAEPEEYETDYMARGYLRQPEAVLWYETVRDVTVQDVGFCYLDSRRLIGCSPDGLVGEDGGLEIKCRQAGKGLQEHMRMLLMSPQDRRVPDQDRAQVQGGLWVTGRAWWDLVYYNPGLPSLVIREEPDPEYQAALQKAVERAAADLLDKRARLEQMGHPGIGI